MVRKAGHAARKAGHAVRKAGHAVVRKAGHAVTEGRSRRTEGRSRLAEGVEQPQMRSGRLICRRNGRVRQVVSTQKTKDHGGHGGHRGCVDAAPRSGDVRPRRSKCEPTAPPVTVHISIFSASHPGLLRRPAASTSLSPSVFLCVLCGFLLSLSVHRVRLELDAHRQLELTRCLRRNGLSEKRRRQRTDVS